MKSIGKLIGILVVLFIIYTVVNKFMLKKKVALKDGSGEVLELKNTPEKVGKKVQDILDKNEKERKKLEKKLGL